MLLILGVLMEGVTIAAGKERKGLGHDIGVEECEKGSVGKERLEGP